MSDLLMEAHGLRKAYGRTEALRGVSFGLAAGERVAITGPSGSGKSTLLLSLAGILRPEAGEIRYAGSRLDDLSETARTRLRRREFGVVLQFGQLVPELTALQNVALPLMLERHDRTSADRLARGWLERLGASDVAAALPGELSGGEAQRVALARALVTSPRIVFADEPTGALDTVSGEALLVALHDAAKEAEAAVVVVTHDNRVAARADREIRLVDGMIA
ncbi:ABC transporter ATP-binding protein [Nocardioides aquiterrae]|uniref:ABC transporter ATP-binding protein n=1 Tax=Nocardioides aquiterrae TaxID=203799 RepID=A0ABN1UEE3_9ACTN